MTQKDEELLLRDLCARLPYGVKCKLIYNNKAIKDEDATLFAIDKYAHFLFAEFGEDTRKFVCKPYLFPLSSMTEEQYNSLYESGILNNCSHSYEYVNPHIHGVSFIFKQFKTYSLELIEWLLKNHFDIYGLIPMDLAVDATNLNIY